MGQDEKAEQEFRWMFLGWRQMLPCMIFVQLTNQDGSLRFRSSEKDFFCFL